jgi:hypothetical protein
VLVVIQANEQAVANASEAAASTAKQIRIDEEFRQTHVQVVAHRRKVVVDLTGEIARGTGQSWRRSMRGTRSCWCRRRRSQRTQGLLSTARRKCSRRRSREGDQLAAADAELEAHERSLAELDERIAAEKATLARLTHFHAAPARS